MLKSVDAAGSGGSGSIWGLHAWGFHMWNQRIGSPHLEPPHQGSPHLRSTHTGLVRVSGLTRKVARANSAGQRVQHSAVNYRAATNECARSVGGEAQTGRSQSGGDAREAEPDPSGRRR